jgi:hypothetical protein
MTVANALEISVISALLLSPLLVVFYPFYRGWQQDNRDRRQREEEQKLRTTREKDKYLYSLIKRQQGRVTLLEYALESGLGAEEARFYLESRATEFGASVVVSEQGETIYQFPMGERSCLS